jgi:hypothetical protein
MSENAAIGNLLGDPASKARYCTGQAPMRAAFGLDIALAAKPWTSPWRRSHGYVWTPDQWYGVPHHQKGRKAGGMPSGSGMPRPLLGG